MDTQKITIGTGVVLVALFLGIFFQEPDTEVIREIIKEKDVGALSSPQIPSDYLQWGGAHGVRFRPSGQSLKTGTTTVCSIQSPAATSTIESVGLKLDTSSTTASTVYIAKGANSNATTTNLVTYAVGANEQAMVTATTTLQSSDNHVVAPDQYINFGMSGGTGTFSPSGACHATFEEYISL